LVLVIQNTTTQATYELDTGISISSILSTFVSGASLSTINNGINETIDASPTLTTFLASNPASVDQWNIAAGQFGPGSTCSNANCKTAGRGIAVFTSSLGTTNNTLISAFALGNLESYVDGLNGSATISGGSLVGLVGNTESTSGVYSIADQEKYGLFPVDDMTAPLGTSSQLFGLTGNGGTGVLQSYLLGSVTVDSAGDVTFATNSAVPVPAAVWLFGSGLLGLVGVSRRRKTAAI
jgi:hypothetical protein